MTTTNQKSASQSAASLTPYAAFIGIDWAKDEHSVHLQAHSDCRPERQTLAQSPTALQQWANGLRQRFAGQPIAVAV